MADYKTLHGTNIDTVSSDPDNPVKGQVWYNSTSKTLKGRILSAAAWSSGGNLNTAKAYLGATKTGSQTASLVFGGTPPTNGLTENESYNGSAWTELADLNTGRYAPGGAGSTTAALAFGGETSPGKKDETETWNGSSWTEGPDLNTERTGLAATGTTTAAIAFGGEESPITGKTETYDGSS